MHTFIFQPVPLQFFHILHTHSYALTFTCVTRKFCQPSPMPAERINRMKAIFEKQVLTKKKAKKKQI